MEKQAQPQPQDREVQLYLNHIAAYDREFSTWETRAKKIIKRYRDENRNSQDSGSRFNILWSNVQTLKAATFARLPKPDVSRRFRDNDQVGRVASLILERALDYEINHYTDYRDALLACVYDRFLGGRGTSWIRYEPKFTTAEAQGLPEDGTQVTDDIESEGQEEQGLDILDYECAPTDYVHWKDFGHNIARTWEEVSIVWRKVYMSKEAIEERFGKEWAQKIPLDAMPEEMKSASKEGVDKQALIYEIWDKNKGKALWLAKSLGKFCDERDDPLQLDCFFPCPRPLYSTITNESLIPVPDYALYQDQAVTLDILSDRIEGLVKALQVKGVYDGSEPALARLFTEGTSGDLLPVKNYAAFAEKNGLKGAINMVDIEPIAQALINAYQAFEQVKAQVYDITGISDIVRGQSVASETATAQQIKGQYASLRLKVYQDDVAQFATQLIQLKAQIICNHFSDETILMISGADQLEEQDKQMVMAALQLLRNDPMRSFRVEISTDSMINMDEQQEKQDRMEFLQVVSTFVEKATQAYQVAPDIMPLVIDLLGFGVRGFKVGKSIEGAIEQTGQQMKKMLKEKQAQPPQPSPEEQKLQAEQQLEQQKMQAEAQRHAAEMQQEAQRNAAEMQQEAQLEQFRSMLEEQRAEREAEREAALRQQEAMMEAQMVRFKALLDAETKINVAQISAKATLSTQQDKASEAAVK